MSILVNAEEHNVTKAYERRQRTELVAKAQGFVPENYKAPTEISEKLGPARRAATVAGIREKLAPARKAMLTAAKIK